MSQYLSEDMGQAWQMVVDALVVGADRHPGFSLPADTNWASAVPLKDNAEQRLVGLASLLGACQHAGRKPPTLALEPAPSFEGEERFVPETAVAHLSAMLRGEDGDVLPEWADLVAGAGLHVPPEFLPEILDAACKELAPVPHLVAIAGPRGRWLAELNEAWAALLPTIMLSDQASDVEAFETGTTRLRVAALHALRHQDAEQARDLLAAGFKKDPAAVRAQLLGALGIELSSGDEAFLESCLDDRSKQVREVAAKLLSQCEGSQLSSRMADRLSAVVEFRKVGLGRKPLLDVNLPDEISIAMKRDGLEERKGYMLGIKGALVADTVAAAPLAWWESTQYSPGQLLDAVLAGDWAVAFYTGWSRAAELQGNALWAEALWRHGFKMGFDKKTRLLDHCRTVASLLPPPVANELMTTALANRKKVAVNWWLLDDLPLVWDRALSQMVLRTVQLQHREEVASEAGNQTLGHDLRHVLSSVLPLHMEPSMSEEVLEGWRAPFEAGQLIFDLVDRLASKLRFRHQVRTTIESIQGEIS